MTKELSEKDARKYFESTLLRNCFFALKDGIMTLVLEWVRESLPDSGRKATTTATLAICWTICFAVTTTASGQTLAGPRLPLRSISWYAAWVPFPKWIWSVIVFVHLARRMRDKHSRGSCCLNQKIDQVHMKPIHFCASNFLSPIDPIISFLSFQVLRQ